MRGEEMKWKNCKSISSKLGQKKTDSPLCHSIDDRKLVSEEEKRLSNYSKVNRTIKDGVQR
jgi:hypothetical protein